MTFCCLEFLIPNEDSGDFQSSTVGRMQELETYEVYEDLIGFLDQPSPCAPDSNGKRRRSEATEDLQ
jgi:hypothetical protein